MFFIYTRNIRKLPYYQIDFTHYTIFLGNYFSLNCRLHTVMLPILHINNVNSESILFIAVLKGRFVLTESLFFLYINRTVKFFLYEIKLIESLIFTL